MDCKLLGYAVELALNTRLLTYDADRHLRESGKAREGGQRDYRSGMPTLRRTVMFAVVRGPTLASAGTSAVPHSCPILRIVLVY